MQSLKALRIFDKERVVKIPLLDLKEQYRSIKTEADAAVKMV